MSISFVQSASATGTGNPVSIAFPSNVTAGSLLIAAVYWNSATETMTVSDNNGNTWTAIGSPLRGAGGLAGFSAQLFYCANAHAGATTVTSTSSGTSRGRTAIHEYAGIATSSPIDVTASYRDLNSATPATNSITTANANDLVFAFCVAANSVSSVGSPFTLREGANWGANGTADDIVSSTGSYSATFNVAGTEDNLLGIVAFKAAVSSGSSLEPSTSLLPSTTLLPSSSSAGTTFHDSPLGTIILSGLFSESRLVSDHPSGTIGLLGSLTEGRFYTDLPVGLILLGGSLTENFLLLGIYSDFVSGTFSLNGSILEQYTSPCNVTAVIAIRGSTFMAADNPPRSGGITGLYPSLTTFPDLTDFPFPAAAPLTPLIVRSVVMNPANC